MTTTVENTTGNAVELTPAELQMIQARRAEQKAAEEKAAAEKALKFEAKIKEQKAQMVKDQNSFVELQAATEKLFEQLKKFAPSQYAVDKVEKIKEYEVYDYDYSQEPENRKTIIWSDKLTYDEAVIVRIGYKAIITAYYYRTASYGPYSIAFKISNFGYDLEKRRMSAAKTIHTNIQEVIDAENYKKEQAELKNNGEGWLMQHVTAKHPTATEIKWNSVWNPNTYNRSSGYKQEKFLVVSFENKFQMRYKFSIDTTGAGTFVATFQSFTGAMDSKMLAEMFAK